MAVEKFDDDRRCDAKVMFLGRGVRHIGFKITGTETDDELMRLARIEAADCEIAWGMK